MTDLTIPDEAWAAAADAFENTAAKFAAEPWYTADVNDVMSNAAIDSVKAAAPLIVAAELRRRSEEFARNARACLSFGCTDFAEGRSTGLAVARDRLRKRAIELDPEGAQR